MAENISICFGTPLWSFKEENPSDLNNKLIQSIEEERKISDGVSISNQGGGKVKVIYIQNKGSSV